MAKKANKSHEKPWDIQPGEKIELYNRFLWYRDMIYYNDPDVDSEKSIDITKHRSLRECANHFGLTKSTIDRQAKEYNWTQRCEEYDKFIALSVQQEHEKKIKKMLNNHAVLGAAMVRRGAGRFISLEEKEISATDAIRMADVGVKIERMARGISGEESTVQITTPKDQGPKPSADVDVPPVFDLTNLSDEELISLEQIVGKLAATDRNES